MTDVYSASQRRKVRGSGTFSSEENYSLKSRQTKSKGSCDLCTAAGNLHDRCRHGCDESDNGNVLRTDSVAGYSSECTAPASAWELNIKCTKTRNPVALGILWGNAEFKNDDSDTGCETDRGTECSIEDQNSAVCLLSAILHLTFELLFEGRSAPSTKVLLTKKVDLGRLKPLAQAEKLRLDKAEKIIGASSNSANWDDVSEYFFGCHYQLRYHIFFSLLLSVHLIHDMKIY